MHQNDFIHSLMTRKFDVRTKHQIAASLSVHQCLTPNLFANSGLPISKTIIS